MKLGLFACLVSFTLVPVCVHAVELVPSLAVSGTYTDNARGDSSNPLSDEVVDVIAGLGLRHSGSRVDINTDVNVVRREFVENTSRAETLPQGRASIFMSLVPEKFVWEIDDRLGRTTSRSFTALGESDRENVNILRTGPDVRLNIAGRNAILLSGRINRATFQDSDIDSQRYSGSATVAHYLSSRSSFGATYSQNLIDYTSNGLYPGSRSKTGFLNYTLDAQRTYFVTELGAEHLYVGNARRESTPHILVGLQRQTSPRWSVNIEYRHAFSDVSDSLRADLIDRFQYGSDQGVHTLAISYKGDIASLMAVRSSGRLMMAWQGGWARENYEPAYDQYDRKNYSAQMEASYAMNSYWGIDAHARWVDDDSLQNGARLQYLTAGLGISRQLSRSIALSLGGERSRTTSKDALQEFSETRVALTIVYAPIGRNRDMFVAPNGLRLYERAGMPRRNAGAQQQEQQRN